MNPNRLITINAEYLRDTLQEAQESLYEAIRLLEIYCRETNDRNAQAYLVDQLKIHAGRGHGFLSSDLNIDDLIDRLDEADDEADVAISVDFPSHDGRYWSTTLGRYVSVPRDDD